MTTRSIAETDREWAAAVVVEHFLTPDIIARGIRHDTRSLPGLVAEHNGQKVGLVYYCIVGTRCEVVALITLQQRQGIGRRLLAEMTSRAQAHGCTHLWLVTTNENRAAQQFYEALGWRKVAVHRDAVAEARRLKPEIPKYAKDGTPIEHEIEYELALDAVNTC